MADQDATLAALQMAIQTELDGYSFYKKFARQTEDPGARAMFERFERILIENVPALKMLTAEPATPHGVRILGNVAASP